MRWIMIAALATLSVACGGEGVDTTNGAVAESRISDQTQSALGQTATSELTRPTGRVADGHIPACARSGANGNTDAATRRHPQPDLHADAPTNRTAECDTDRDAHSSTDRHTDSHATTYGHTRADADASDGSTNRDADGSTFYANTGRPVGGGTGVCDLGTGPGVDDRAECRSLLRVDD